MPNVTQGHKESGLEFSIHIYPSDRQHIGVHIFKDETPLKHRWETAGINNVDA